MSLSREILTYLRVPPFPSRMPRHYRIGHQMNRKFSRIIDSLPLGILPFTLVMLLVLQFGIPPLALPQQETAPPPSAKQILVLYTYAGGITVNQKATGAFFSALTSRGFNNDDVFLEYLDLQRNNSPAYRRRVANLLLDKYGKRDIGLIVTLHTWALEFLLEECKGLFPDVPIFSFLVARPELIKAKNTGRRILLRPQNMDMGGTLEIALKMFPETRKVVFVVGAAPADKRFELEARHIFEPWRGKVEIEYTSDRTYEEMLQLVATLPRRSIVIYCDVFSDVTGRTFTPLEVGKMVAKAANAPVFCLWDTIMGWGTIGGSLLSFEAEGAYAAKTALDILDKKIVLTKPETTFPSSKTYMFDWRQLRRWKLSEAALPKGSIVINRELTFWDFKYYIIGGLAFVLLETTLIIFLIVQKRRKKVTEESLRRKTEELDQFFNVSLDLLSIANTDGYFLRLNPAWERTLGYTSEELLAKRFLEFVHPDDMESTLKALSSLASRQKVFYFENRYRCKDGTYRWLQWSSSPAGNLIYSAARDVTENKRAEAEAFQARSQLFQLDRLSRMGELTASLAHELNQPLAAILSNAQAGLRFLQSGKIDLDELREILQDITQDDQRAGSVIRSLRSMVKREEVERKPVILNNVLNDVVQIFHTESVFRNVRVETELDGSLPPVLGDKVQLQQVVLNLILNAADAMSENPPEQRKIILCTRVKDDRVRVTVRDFGAGVDQANLERIFEAFFTTKGAGLGMGLNICRAVVEAHGGRIRAENNPDRGATFVFELPAIRNQ